MRRDAAALGRLLAAAQADLASDLAATGADVEAGDHRARVQCIRDLGVDNAYRSAVA